MNRALFLDRDGTVIEELGYLADPTQVRLLPGAAEALAALQTQGWRLFIVSNQSGVARGLIQPEQMDAVQNRFLDLMREHGIEISESYFCVHSPEENCECRKPSPWFLQQAAAGHGINLAQSWMIGDREGDLLCGVNAGCSTIWLKNELFEVPKSLPTFIASNWMEILDRLLRA